MRSDKLARSYRVEHLPRRDPDLDQDRLDQHALGGGVLVSPELDLAHPFYI